ncbi:uncharacterized protein PV09_02992 [Verruconis gallopava]|uniref:Arrestin-like N-terminal domain-containing protein n=1 Tax=Verruconis gallopava TaxID=253628 RepID=A0A0D2AI82_9PEZI|nr:uncharacterized protein PV09_02992 [Verruconis gallopava]KIW06563.1 hypothetical protein PV09_02992 [Verruconis gallopava]
MPELTIRLHDARTRIYGPGDTVSGSVIFIPLFSARLRSLIVSLQGYCYTSSLSANAKVSHVVPFLRLSTSTMEETYTYIGETYEAPFSFKFPEDTDVVHEAGPDRLRSVFNQGPQALPSSVVICARNCVQTVRYMIEVEIHGRTRATCEETILFRQSEKRLRDGNASREQEESRNQLGDNAVREDRSSSPTSPRVDYETWRSDRSVYYHRPEMIRLPEAKGCSRLSLHALPMISTHHKSAVDRYKHAKNQNRGGLPRAFKSWKTPKMVFMPSIYCPQKTAVDQEIPLLLAVDTIRNPVWEGLGEEHQLVLEEFSLAVTAHNRTIMQNRPHKRRWGRCLELSYAVIQASGLAAQINLDAVPTPLVQNFKILPGTIPSFATYTLSRGYSIDVHFKFSFGDEQLEWGASMELTITADDSTRLAEGVHMDPLLFVDPKREPQYFWRSHVEAGAAESTSRSSIDPSNFNNVINMPGMQWETGHGRLPRTSFACATAQLRPELMPVKGGRGKAGALNIVAGVCGRPRRRYIRELEPVTRPLFTFQHGLGIDGARDHVCRAESV